MCKLVVSGLSLFLAGMYWNHWVDVCKHEPLMDSLFLTIISVSSFAVAFVVAWAIDIGLGVLWERFQNTIQTYRDALDYMAECKRKEVEHDRPSNQ